MANTVVTYDEIRFDVRDPELTHVFILIKNQSNDGFPVGGWHHKVFPASKSVIDILDDWGKGIEQPLAWDKGAPK